MQSTVAPVIFGMDDRNENDEPEYGVFVSHAWEDKEDFVDEGTVKIAPKDKWVLMCKINGSEIALVRPGTHEEVYG